MPKDQKFFLELLKTMPTGLSAKLRIGENDYACKQLKCTLQDIKIHNAECDGYAEGYKEAVEKFEKWRAEITNKLIY